MHLFVNGPLTEEKFMIIWLLSAYCHRWRMHIISQHGHVVMVTDEIVRAETSIMFTFNGQVINKYCFRNSWLHLDLRWC